MHRGEAGEPHPRSFAAFRKPHHARLLRSLSAIKAGRRGDGSTLEQVKTVTPYSHRVSVEKV